MGASASLLREYHFLHGVRVVLCGLHSSQNLILVHTAALGFCFEQEFINWCNCMVLCASYNTGDYAHRKCSFEGMDYFQ